MDSEIKLPDIGLEKVEVIEILVNLGDYVKIDDGLIVIEGQKTSMEVPSPISGVVNKIYVKIGDKVQTNSIIMSFKKSNFDTDLLKNEKNLNLVNSNIQKQLITIKNSNTKNFNKNTILEKKFLYASPFIRRLARKKNIDLSKIVGTGLKNRILIEDLLSFNNLNGNKIEKSNFKLDNTKSKINLDVYSSNIYKELKLSHIQISSGIHLSKCWSNLPHVTQFNEIDITDLEEFRKNYNNKKQFIGKKITILSFLVKSVFKSLEEFPIFNSCLSKDKKSILLKKNINIGIAIDTKSGLLVPVLKNIKYKSILDISNEIIDFSNKAKSGKLSFSDLQEGTFTISNLGSIGGTNFTPIINSPEVGILGLSKSDIKPVWNGTEFIPRLILPFSVSYDHRVIDGVYACRFTKSIQIFMNDIRLLLF